MKFSFPNSCPQDVKIQYLSAVEFRCSSGNRFFYFCRGERGGFAGFDFRAEVEDFNKESLSPITMISNDLVKGKSRMCGFLTDGFECGTNTFGIEKRNSTRKPRRKWGIRGVGSIAQQVIIEDFNR